MPLPTVSLNSVEVKETEIIYQSGVINRPKSPSFTLDRSVIDIRIRINFTLDRISQSF